MHKLLSVVAVALATLVASRAVVASPLGYNGAFCGVNEPEPMAERTPPANATEPYQWYNCGGGTWYEGAHSCRINGSSPAEALSWCNVYWQYGLSLGVCPMNTAPSTGFHGECLPEAQYPLREWICSGLGSRGGSTHYSERAPVIVEAASLSAAKQTAWYVDDRPGYLLPILAYTTCATVKTASDAQDPNAPLWHCDEKKGDVVPLEPVHATDRAEAVSWAMRAWIQVGAYIPPANVLCRQGTGPLIWECGGRDRSTGGILPPHHVSATTWAEAVEHAYGWWHALKVSPDEPSVDCAPAGNSFASGPTVAWYCAGAGDAGDCSLPPVQVYAPSDEEEIAVRQVAAAHWMSGGADGQVYAPEWGSINCAHANTWIPSNAPAWTCEDTSGAAPGAAVPASTESQAIALAQDAWGGAVLSEDTLCSSGSSPNAVCVSGSGNKVQWECSGLDWNGSPLPPHDQIVEDENQSEYWVKGIANSKWRAAGYDPNFSTIHCEPGEPTYPGWPNEPPSPDDIKWKCTGTASTPFPHSPVWYGQASSMINAEGKALKAWHDAGKHVWPNSVACWPWPAP